MDSFLDAFADQRLAERAADRDTSVARVGFDAVDERVANHAATGVDELDDGAK